MTGEKWRAIGKWGAWALVFVLITYTLSYAPIVRSRVEAGDLEVTFRMHGWDFPTYQPIDWLIDNTPFDKPLFAWARLWGVGHAFEFASSSRTWRSRRRQPKMTPLPGRR